MGYQNGEEEADKLINGLDWTKASEKDKSDTILAMTLSKKANRRIMARLLASGVLDNFAKFLKSEEKELRSKQSDDDAWGEHAIDLMQAVSHIASAMILASIPASTDMDKLEELVKFVMVKITEGIIQMAIKRDKLMKEGKL